jgi:hypothetical protein
MTLSNLEYCTVVRFSSINELYIALEKYPRKDIAKLQKMDLHLVLRKNYTGSRLQLDTNK